MDWTIWRVVLSGDVPDGLSQVRGWSLPDLLEAHLALDALEDLRALQEERIGCGG